MKDIYLILYIIFFAVIAVFTSCNEDEFGPFFNDGTIPPVVTEIQVENLPGGAKISYKIPDDKDILLVEAKYKLDNGTDAFARSSVFKNFVTLQGLRKVTPQEVELVTVDKGNNKSEVTKVEINPMPAPIDLLVESFQVGADFGGPQINFLNKDGNRYEIQLVLDSLIDGKMIPVFNQSVFIENAEITKHTFRPFESVEREFKFVIVDRWSNLSDTLSAITTPKQEILLDSDLFSRNILPTDGAVLSTWLAGDFFVDKLWDGSIEAPNIMHTTDINPPLQPALPPYTQPNLISFTINLGEKANLSRIRMFNTNNSSGGNFFTRGNPRKFEMWGVDVIPADNGASFNGWHLLIKDGEQIKPSGAPPFDESAEDRELAERGIDFATDPSPTVQYIRFVVLETWEGGLSNWVQLGELEVYGQPVQ